MIFHSFHCFHFGFTLFCSNDTLFFRFVFLDECFSGICSSTEQQVLTILEFHLLYFHFILPFSLFQHFHTFEESCQQSVNFQSLQISNAQLRYDNSTTPRLAASSTRNCQPPNVRNYIMTVFVVLEASQRYGIRGGKREK